MSSRYFSHQEGNDSSPLMGGGEDGGGPESARATENCGISRRISAATRSLGGPAVGTQTAIGTGPSRDGTTFDASSRVSWRACKVSSRSFLQKGEGVSCSLAEGNDDTGSDGTEYAWTLEDAPSPCKEIWIAGRLDTITTGARIGVTTSGFGIRSHFQPEEELRHLLYRASVLETALFGTQAIEAASLPPSSPEIVPGPEEWTSPTPPPESHPLWCTAHSERSLPAYDLPWPSRAVRLDQDASRH
jgi:hypothetical protein